MIKSNIISSLFLMGFGISISQPLYAVKWLDNDLPKDDMNFLGNKHPKLKEESKKVSLEETDPELKEITEIANGSKDSKVSLIEGLKERLSASVFDPSFYNCDYQKQQMNSSQEAIQLASTDQIQDQELLAAHFKRKGMRTIHEEIIYARQSDPTYTVLEDVVLGAQWIDRIVNSQGRNSDKILFLGRTPCFVQVAYEELSKMKYPASSLNTIHLSFSGSPDVESQRIGTVYKDQERDIRRNMLTLDKLNFYEVYMTSQGMDKVEDKLYLVDMVGKGGSLNSFLRILRHYYVSTQKREKMPEIHFIPLNLKLGADQTELWSETNLWNFKHEEGILTFNSVPEKGIRPLEIKATPIQLTEGTIKEILDRDMVQFLFTHGMEFPAERWHPGFQEKLKSGGMLHKEFYKIFRPKIQKILGEHQKLFSQKAAAELD